MTLILRSATVSDLGLVRENNEDSAYAGSWLVAVADGVGGLPAGELASELVIGVLKPLDRPLDVPDPPGGTQDGPVAVLRAAIEEANRRVGELAAADPAREGMGTTLSALLLAGDRLALAHVGDSRGYRLRDRTLARLTRDDTYVQSLVDQGVIAEADVRGHPLRSVVTQAVQGHPITPATGLLSARVGDRYLLCSDGLSDVVSGPAITEALATVADVRECARELVRLAIAAGGPDNVTVVVADVVDAP